MASKKIKLDKFIDSYMELASQDPSILDDMLKEQGYDPDKVGTNGIQAIRHFFFQQEVAQKKRKITDLYNRAIGLVQNAAGATKETILQMLQQKAPSFQFRNLEKLDEENLRQILNETEILELIDQLEKNEQK